MILDSEQESKQGISFNYDVLFFLPVNNFSTSYLNSNKGFIETFSIILDLVNALKDRFFLCSFYNNGENIVKTGIFMQQ